MHSSLVTSLRRAVCATAVVLLSAPFAFAQDPHPKATSAGAAPPGEPVVTLAGVAGQLKGSAFQAQLDASADERSATATIGWKDGSSVYALTFKGPLNAKSKEATPISLDGLSNGSTVKFTLNHLFWRGPDEDEQAESDEICDRLFPKQQPCDYQKMKPGKDRKRYEKLQHLSDVPWYLGASGGVSVTTYSFLEGSDLKEASDTKTDYALTLTAGFFRPQLGFVIGSAAVQQTSAPGADSVSLCQPLQDTAATACSDAVLKPPTQKTSALLTLHLRRKLAGDVAISPSIQRDVQKKVWAVLIPVYFLKDAKGSPIGGVRGSWRSDTKAVVVSLFVGAAFGLTP